MAGAKAQRWEAGARAGPSVEGRYTLNAKEEVWAVSQWVLERAVAGFEGWAQALTGKGQEGMF